MIDGAFRWSGGVIAASTSSTDKRVDQAEPHSPRPKSRYRIRSRMEI